MGLEGGEKGEMLTREICTRWYKSPEQLLGSYAYDEKVDIWAAGCVLQEFLSGDVLFRGFCDVDQLGRIFHALGTVDLAKWPAVERLPDWGKIQFKHIPPAPNQYLDSKGFLDDSV